MYKHHKEKVKLDLVLSGSSPPASSVAHLSACAAADGARRLVGALAAEKQTIETMVLFPEWLVPLIIAVAFVITGLTMCCPLPERGRVVAVEGGAGADGGAEGATEKPGTASGEAAGEQAGQGEGAAEPQGDAAQPPEHPASPPRKGRAESRSLAGQPEPEPEPALP